MAHSARRSTRGGDDSFRLPDPRGAVTAPTVSVPDAELPPDGESLEGAPNPGLLGYVMEAGREIAAHRDLLYYLTRRDIRIRYKETVMGFGWALLLPILVLMSGIIVQLAMARFAGTALDPLRIAGVVVKAVPWAFFVSAIGFSTATLLANVNLVGKVYFPREVLPIAAVLAQTVDLAVAGVVTAVALPFFGVRPTMTALWVPVLIGTLLAVTIGLGLLLSCANAFFRDVKYLVQVFLTYGIFFTPVFFDASILGRNGASLLMANPVAPVLEGMRLAVVSGHNLAVPLHLADGTLVWSPLYLAWSAGFGAVAILAGVYAFRRSQYLFAELL